MNCKYEKNANASLLRNKHILVTGANGFLGRHLVRELSLTGAKLTQVVRSKPSSGDPQLSIVILDLLDRKKVLEIFSTLQPDYVIDLAGVKDRGGMVGQFRNVFDNNVSGSLNVVEACLELKHFNRLVFIGSCDEYGKSVAPFAESQREVPTNSYALSKLAITKMLSALYLSSHFPSVVLRPSVIFGPYQGVEMFLPALIQSLLEKKDFAMTQGEQYRDFVYVTDVVDAIVKTLVSAERVNGKVFNIGSGISHQVKDIAKIVAELIHPEAFKHLRFGAVDYRTGETMDYAVDIDRAKQLLMWEPKTELKQALQETIDCFRPQVEARISALGDHA